MKPRIAELQKHTQIFDDHEYTFGDNDTEPWVIKMDETYKERGAVWAMVSVHRCVNGQPLDPPVVGPSRVNIVRESRGGGLIDVIEKIAATYPEYTWDEMFQQAKLLTLRNLEQRLEPVSLALKVGDNSGPPFLSRPYLAGNGLTILYGDGGTGKSNLALTVSLELAAGRNIISGFVPHQPRGVLYIDYEDTHDTHSDRVLALANAHNIPEPVLASIHRTSLVDILAVHTKELVRYIDANNIGFVVLDSLGMACGGDITASEPVIRMGQAIRALGVPVLGIHHSNKAGLPYGSVYIKNMARLMWHAQPRQSKLDDPWDYIYLENEKANNVRRQATQYLKVKFTNEEHHLVGIRFEPTDVHGFPEADQAPTKGSINLADQFLLHLQLNAGSRFTAITLASEFDTTEQSARNQLNKLAKEGRIHKDDTGSPKTYWIDDLPSPF